MLHRAFGVVQDGGFRLGLAARKGGNEAGGLQRGDERIALADGSVGRVAGAPDPVRQMGALPVLAAPLWVGDARLGELRGQLDARQMIVTEALGLRADQVGSGFQAVFVEEDVAGIANRAAQVTFAMAVAGVAGETPVADHVVTGADDLGVGRVNGAGTQAGDGGDDLEGGARRVLALDRAVEPAA